jgi:hypothetical protein
MKSFCNLHRRPRKKAFRRVHGCPGSLAALNASVDAARTI